MRQNDLERAVVQHLRSDLDELEFRSINRRIVLDFWVAMTYNLGKYINNLEEM